MTLASFFSWADRFESTLVADPEGRFSRNEAHMFLWRTTELSSYHNVPKFSDRLVWANSVDPDETAPRLIRVYTVCNSLCIVQIHYSKEKPSCLTFRVITAHFRVSEILGFLRYQISYLFLWQVQAQVVLKYFCKIAKYCRGVYCINYIPYLT